MKLDWTLVPWKGVEAVAQVMRDNVGKHGSHWTTVSREEHIKALARHVVAVMSGDTSENHLAHAATRALMALASEAAGDGERLPLPRGWSHVVEESGGDEIEVAIARGYDIARKIREVGPGGVVQIPTLPSGWEYDITNERYTNNFGYVELVNGEWVAMLTRKASVPRRRFGDDTDASFEAAMKFVEGS